MVENDEEDQECMNISFSGCGFLGIYHVGVASAIKEYAPHLYMTKVAGASAGAIAACGLISNMCLSQATSDVLKIVALARQHQLGPLHPSINLMNILRSGLMKNLPDDAHKMASGRLFISMTRVSDGKNVLVSQYDTKEELIQALLCSSFIPLYGGTLPPTFRGVRYMDGGFSDNLPILNGNTVTVSPFSGESDICPQDRDSQSFLSFDLTNMNIRFTSRNFYRFSVALFPPHPEIMSSICRQGFEDTLRFLARHNLIACARCIEVRSSIVLDESTTREIAAIYSQQQRRSSLRSDDKRSPSSSKYQSPASTSPTSDENSSKFSLSPSSINKKVKFDVDGDADQQATTSAVVFEAPKQNTGCGQHGVVSEGSRPLAQSMSSKRLQSVKSFGKLIENDDCETCRLMTVAASKRGLPEGVRQTLADAEAVERTLLRYILELKPVKWLRYMTIPWFLPVDIGFSIFKKFLAWLPSWREDSLWVASQASDVVASFLSRETDEQKAKAANSRLTCEMAITDLTFSSNDQIDQQTLLLPRGEPQLPVPLTSTSKSAGLPSISSRRSSMMGGGADSQSISSTLAGGLQSGGQCTVTEMNFGFSVDLASSSEPVRQMADIVVRDDVKKRDVRASAVADLAEDLEIEGLRKVTALNPEQQNNVANFATSAAGQNSPPISLDSLLLQQQQENFDTYAAILNYTHKRDALMAYYYMDENNHVKVTKIFGCDKNPSNVGATQPQQQTQPMTSRNAHLRLQGQKEQQPEIVGVAKVQPHVIENFQQEVSRVKTSGSSKPEKMVAVVSPFVQSNRQSQSNREKIEDANSGENLSNMR